MASGPQAKSHVDAHADLPELQMDDEAPDEDILTSNDIRLSIDGPKRYLRSCKNTEGSVEKLHVDVHADSHFPNISISDDILNEPVESSKKATGPQEKSHVGVRADLPELRMDDAAPDEDILTSNNIRVLDDEPKRYLRSSARAKELAEKSQVDVLDNLSY